MQAAAPLPEEGEVEELVQLLEGKWGSERPRASPSADGPGGDPAVGAEPRGDAVSVAPPRVRDAGAPAWSLLVPPYVWFYLSRLEFYEADASLPAQERLFHFWWLKRMLVRARFQRGCRIQGEGLLRPH